MCSQLVEDVTHPEEIVRRAAAECLAKSLTCHRGHIVPTLQLLLARYEEKLVVRICSCGRGQCSDYFVQLNGNVCSGRR
ncbi:hypothetical protein DPMN_011199 [Dreissena polymorpha]|uniref:Uncharacterized protein n=1 Tax=Dreissena polymorpha TaxID=45954 RepID=A0A9D4N3G5_DREPO|nr:hypothetical protein DPMN_011199 [Dreissena polymorpha]